MWSILGHGVGILEYCPFGILQKTPKFFTNSKDTSQRKRWISRVASESDTLHKTEAGSALVRTQGKVELYLVICQLTMPTCQRALFFGDSSSF